MRNKVEIPIAATLGNYVVRVVKDRVPGMTGIKERSLTMYKVFQGYSVEEHLCKFGELEQALNFTREKIGVKR